MNNLLRLLMIAMMVTLVGLSRAGSPGLASIIAQEQGGAAQKSVSQQDGGRQNPFLTEEESKFFKERGDIIPLKYLTLSAIFYSTKQSTAIINGKVLREGDIIDNKRIIKIKPEEVLLQDTRSTYVVSMAEVITKPNPFEQK